MMRAKNLKYLRNKFKEKQEVLAGYLGICQNTLSNYERGRLPIPDEIVQQLAYHYNVSVFDFNNSNLSEIAFLLFPEEGFIPQKNLMAQFANVMIIITPPGLDTNDPVFAEGYEIFHSLRKTLFQTEATGWEELPRCLQLFQESWNKSKDEAAIANYVSIIMLLSLEFHGVKSSQSGELYRAIINEEKLDSLGAQNIVLRNVPSAEKLEKRDKERVAFVRKHNEVVMSYIKTLKQSSNCDYRELADYFLWLMYYVGFVDNELELEENKSIAEILFPQLCQLENRYVLNWINVVLPHIGNCDI